MSTAHGSGSSSATPSLALVLVALVPFGLGYFMSYLFRAANAVVAPDLVRELGLSASELGLLTAAYLLAFALFQLPLGILLDRFGPRRVQAALLLAAALGSIGFALGQSLLHVTLARAVIGFGVAGALMSGFKAVVIWVPEARRPLANSFVMSLGALGLLVSTVPLEAAVQASDWRTVFLGLAAITALISLLIYVVVPERAAAPVRETLADQIKVVAQIYRDPAFLRLAPMLGATAGVHIALQTLWAAPWLRDVAELDRGNVANALLLMAAAFFVGILVTGAIADWFTQRGASVLDVMLGLIVIYLVGQTLIVFDVVPLRVPAWAIFGMSGQVAILAYPWLSSHFGATRSGRANTAMNLVIFLAAFAVQYAIGWVIDLYPRSPSGGYAREAYGMAFGLFLALQVVTVLWFLTGRRRYFSIASKPQAA